MLTGLGAIMDVAVTISAATGEIVRKNPDVSLRKLIHSGREIGYDIMGTMINVLLFVLASSMIPMFILKMNNEIRFITIIRYHIPYDICRFLIESIGIVLAIPVSVFISSIIMKLPSLKRSDKNDNFSCTGIDYFNDSDWWERGAVSLMTLAGNIVILFISILLMSIGFPALLLILAAGQESAIIPCSTRMETIQRHGRLFWLPCL